MKFLVDAQLPRRFAGWLNEAWHDALHTLDLPSKNYTPDSELIEGTKWGRLNAATKWGQRLNGVSIAIVFQTRKYYAMLETSTEITK